MRKIKTFILTLLLTAVLLFAEIMLVKNVSGDQPQGEAVYAVSKINEGSVITPEMLIVKEISLSALNKHSLTDPGEAVGKIAFADIEKDEMILSTRLAEQKSPEIIRLLGERSRLISIEFETDHANAWQLETDGYVDIIFIPQALAQMSGSAQYLGQFPAEQARRYENIRIAGLVDAQGKIIKGGEKDSTSSDNKPAPRYVILEVVKGMDEEIALAKVSGILELSVVK